VDWIDVAQDRDQWRAFVRTVMNLRVLKNAGKFLSSCTTGGFSRRAQLHEVSYCSELTESFNNILVHNMTMCNLITYLMYIFTVIMHYRDKECYLPGRDAV
jgi:hypothetical protein